MSIFNFAHISHLRSASNRALLHRFYHELMIPNFPDTDELDSLEVWEEILQRDRSKRQDYVYVDIMLAFDKNDKERKKILGGVAYEYFRRANVYLLTYLVIDDAARGKGLGVYLVLEAWKDMNENAALFGQKDGINAIFMEANDPKALPADAPDGMDAVERLRAFQQMGVRQIPHFKYVQPSLDTHKKKVTTLLLGVILSPKTPYHDGKPYVEAVHIRDFLNDYYSDCEVTDYLNDHDFKQQMTWLDGKEKIFLTDFDLPPRKPKAKAAPPATVSGARKLPLIKTPGGSPLHVIVIGAGLAGLACAQRLARRGFLVTVLEGRHRIGGRVYTSRTYDTRIDVGATWIHGSDGNILYDMVRTSLPDVKLYQPKDDTLRLCDESSAAIDGEAIFNVFQKFQGLMQAVEEKYPKVDGDNVPHNQLSLADALHDVYNHNTSLQCKNGHERLLLNYYLSQLENVNGASLSELSAIHHDAATEFQGGDHMVSGGFHSVALSLSRDLDIQMGQVVTKIEVNPSLAVLPSPFAPLSSPSSPSKTSHNGGGGGNSESKQVSSSSSSDDMSASSMEEQPIRVTLKDGRTLTAHSVVCSVPLGVLKAKTIEFVPPLPSRKLNAIDRLGVACANKVVLRFPSVFWDRDTDWIGCNIDINAVTASSSSSSSSTASSSSSSSLHRTRHNLWFLNYYPIVKEPILVATITGELHEVFKTLSDRDIIDHIMRTLRFMYNGNGNGNTAGGNGGVSVPSPVDTSVHRWDRDPFACGSSTYLRRGSSTSDLAALATPAHNLVFFAGEATSETRYSNADGAYASGIREADRIIRLFAPPSPGVAGHSAHAKHNHHDNTKVAQSKL